MAAFSFVQRKEDFKEEFLTCPICVELYDNQDHTAKCLPCLHTFCKCCLNRLVGKKSKFDCPNCRRRITLPGPGRIDNLPSNFIVENLKRYQDIFNMDVICANCDERNNAVSFCHDCGMVICQNCLENHKKMRILQHHRVVTLKELQESRYNPVIQQQEKCKKHPKHELTLYCQKKECDMAVCPTCALAHHRSHDLVEITVAMESAVKNLTGLSKKVGDQNKILTSARESIKKGQENLKMVFAKQKNEIDQIEKEICEMVRSRCRLARSSLDNLYRTETEYLIQRETRVNSLSKQMTSACNFANSACDTSHPIQLLGSQKQIRRRLEELTNVQLPDDHNQTNEINFAFSSHHHATLQRFEALIENICEVQKCKAKKLTTNNDTDNKVEPGLSTVTLKGAPKKYEQCLAILTTKNAHGNHIGKGGAFVDAKLHVHILKGKPRRCVIQDNDDGTYMITYTPFSDANDLYVTVNGEAIGKSPLRIQIDDA